MVSKSGDSSKSRKSQGEPTSDDLRILTCKINQLKKQIQAERVVLISEKVEDNRKKIESNVSKLLSLAMSRTDDSSMENNDLGKMLSARIENPLCMLNGLARGSSDKDNAGSQEVAISMSAKLPLTMKIPPYTTWIFLDRNQRMAEDQSVVGRRQIYYDKHGSEALICSDSEEDIAEPEEEKHEFSEAENRIIRMVSQDYEPREDVLNILTQFVGGTTEEIQEVYSALQKKDQDKSNKNEPLSSEVDHYHSTFLDKSLSASLDSLDNLFCRRCLVFDCRLHGYSQTIITPSERQYCPLDSQEDGKPCSDQCYLKLQAAKKYPENLGGLRTEVRTSEECVYEISFNGADPGKRKISKQKITLLDEPTQLIGDLHESSNKKQKTLSIPDTVPLATEDTQPGGSLNNKTMDPEASTPDNNELHRTSHDEAIGSDDAFSSSVSASADILEDNNKGDTKATTAMPIKYASTSVGIQAEASPSNYQWKPLEKELYMKGLEIFGRNSCLIARNLLSGLKTCIEVSSYMYESGAGISQRSLPICSMSDDNARAGAEHKEQDMPPRSRLLRRRGRTRKLKYSWKSAGHPSIWRRIADGKNQSCKQYIPCGCKSMCGKQCPCLENGTCCEKYCGCSKSCKNRFRGCHCAKSQCRSRQCPCFAAGRECDPDVCRNCWVSCGDGSLGEPPRRGEGQCGNMRLLLRQQQRILLARSDVAGWGAFLKNSVNKNDYLGEYTGELISHREADKRGKIYDRANSSFLFDLNDQYVLDAYRKGDKLKFANHSSNPNCYAKVMLVAGDHRVGIFANERIEASEELFYDYRYGPDQAPIWARKPDGSKGEDFPVPQGRAKKHQSHR